MVVQNQTVKATDCEPGVTRKVLAHSDELMMTEVCFAKGAKGNRHKHPHRQITYVAKGAFEFTLGDKTHTVSAGDSILIDGDLEHGVLALEDGILVDVFTPARKDFL